MNPFWEFLKDKINSLSALGEAWPLEGGAVHLWGHRWPGGTISRVEQAELSALWFGVEKDKTTRPWGTANLAQPLRALLGSGVMGRVQGR